MGTGVVMRGLCCKKDSEDEKTSTRRWLSTKKPVVCGAVWGVNRSDVRIKKDMVPGKVMQRRSSFIKKPVRWITGLDVLMKGIFLRRGEGIQRIVSAQEPRFRRPVDSVAARVVKEGAQRKKMITDCFLVYEMLLDLHDTMS